MLSTKLISKQEYRRATWKNGLGYTDEIAIYPQSADLRRGDFLWRLSSARIERASPFSAFPAHDRTLVILKGQGIRLTHTFEEGGESETVELPLLQPYDFPGDVPSRCDLISGPVTDMSVFVRKAEAEAVTEAITLDDGEEHEWVPQGRWNFAYAAAGGVEVTTFDGHAQEIPEGDTLSLELEAPLPEGAVTRLRATGPAAKVVLVSVQG